MNSDCPVCKLSIFSLEMVFNLGAEAAYEKVKHNKSSPLGHKPCLGCLLPQPPHCNRSLLTIAPQGVSEQLLHSPGSGHPTLNPIGQIYSFVAVTSMVGLYSSHRSQSQPVCARPKDTLTPYLPSYQRPAHTDTVSSQLPTSSMLGKPHLSIPHPHQLLLPVTDHIYSLTYTLKSL